MAKLENNKWMVENLDGKTDIVIEGLEIKHSVYIYKCKNCLVTVKGKCSSVALDNCTKSGVIFDTAVASLEIVNCKGAKAQINGSVPSIVVDNTAGATIFIGKDGKGAEVYTSKSTEVNLNVTKDDGDFHETPIPSQFVTKYINGKWVTVAVEHVGV